MDVTGRSAPRRPLIAWLCAIVASPFYWWYWYGSLVRDMREAARSQGVSKLGPAPVIAVLMTSIGSCFVVPMIVSLIQTGRLIASAQHAYDEERRYRLWVAPVVMGVGYLVAVAAPILDGGGAVLVYLIGLVVLNLPVYILQSHANSVLAGRRDFVRRPAGVTLGIVAVPAIVWTTCVLPLSVLGGSGQLKAYRIPAGGMEPSLQCGDRFIAERLTNRSDHPRRGDVVVFRAPVGKHLVGPRARQIKWSDESFVKRVVGLPGDRVAVRNHRAIVNGRKLREPYVLSSRGTYGEMAEMKETMVPSGNYFVLGDHRDKSMDSRHFGFIPRSVVVGRAVHIYWPPNRAGVPTKIANRYSIQGGFDPSCMKFVLNQ